MTDSSRRATFAEEIAIEVGVRVKGTSGGDQPPRNTTKTLLPPHVKEIRKAEWDQYHMESHGALRVFDSGEGTYDFFVNIENDHLLAELVKHKEAEKISAVQSQYKYGMALVGLAVIQHYLNKEDETDEEVDISEAVYEYTKVVSPIFVPMIHSVGGIGVD